MGITMKWKVVSCSKENITTEYETATSVCQRLFVSRMAECISAIKSRQIDAVDNLTEIINFRRTFMFDIHCRFLYCWEWFPLSHLISIFNLVLGLLGLRILHGWVMHGKKFLKKVLNAIAELFHINFVKFANFCCVYGINLLISGSLELKLFKVSWFLGRVIHDLANKSQ